MTTNFDYQIVISMLKFNFLQSLTKFLRRGLDLREVWKIGRFKRSLEAPVNL